MTRNLLCLLIFFALGITAIHAKQPTYPVSRADIYSVLKTNKIIDLHRKLVSFYHVCDLLIAGKRLPVIYLSENMIAPEGLPERGARTTIVLNSKRGISSKIEGQSAAPISCIDNYLIFSDDVSGLEVGGSGNAIKFAGIATIPGVISAEPIHLENRDPLPNVNRPGKPIQ
jgi:hypothetical protein